MEDIGKVVDETNEPSSAKDRALGRTRINVKIPGSGIKQVSVLLTICQNRLNQLRKHFDLRQSHLKSLSAITANISAFDLKNRKLCCLSDKKSPPHEVRWQDLQKRISKQTGKQVSFFSILVLLCNQCRLSFCQFLYCVRHPRTKCMNNNWRDCDYLQFTEYCEFK